VARRHPGQDTLTLLCWESVWGKPDYTCHRRVFASWWREQTGEVIEEWPARPRSSTTQPTTHVEGLQRNLVDSGSLPAVSGDPQPSRTKKEDV